MHRSLGREPAKIHDLLTLSQGLILPNGITKEDLVFLSEERIPSFYGGSDFVPTEEYDEVEALRCLEILKIFGLIK